MFGREENEFLMRKEYVSYIDDSINVLHIYTRFG